MILTDADKLVWFRQESLCLHVYFQNLFLNIIRFRALLSVLLKGDALKCQPPPVS